MTSLLLPALGSGAGCPCQKPRLLLISDSAAGLDQLRVPLNRTDVEIKSVSNLEELLCECDAPHTLAAVNVNTAQLPQVLDILRRSQQDSEILVLIEPDQQPTLLPAAGLLPKYRAMPCNLRELVALASPTTSKPLHLPHPML